MLPVPSLPARILFVTVVAMALFGVASAHPGPVILAAAGGVLIAIAFVLTLPRGRRLRRERLEFAWWLDHAAGAAAGSVVPGMPFDVRCFVRHRGDEGLSVSEVAPLTAPGAELVALPPALELPARTRAEFRIRVRAPAMGRVVLHGLAMRLRGPFGLFETPLYFPNPLVIKVLPQAAAGRRGASRARPLASAQERSGRAFVRRRGGGTEFHELRDFVAGDPFKAIAWKASARRGRLLVREVEQEVQQTRWILVDVSGTMRGGAPGQRKLDYALEAAAAEARRALTSGDRVGLITFDSRIVAHVAPRDGHGAVIRIYEALLDATELVDADLTDASTDLLFETVARYLRHQDGLDFRRRYGLAQGALVEHVQRALRDEDEIHIESLSDADRALRHFCQARGLKLPHRPSPPTGAKGAALVHAIQVAGGRSRASATIQVLTDFDTITNKQPVLDAVKLARTHGHQVRFTLPDARSFAPENEPGIGQTLAQVYGRGEARRLDEAIASLRRLGVAAHIVGKERPPALAFEMRPTKRRPAGARASTTTGATAIALEAT